MSILEINFKNENVPVDVESNSTTTSIAINDNKYPAVIKLDVNKAIEVADAILKSIGELNSDEFNDKIYELDDKIEELESLLIAARVKKQAIEAEKLTGDNIYKVLIYFDQLYGKMNDREKRQLIEELISEIQIYPERQPNGQWLKSIKFRLPIIEEDMNISLDNEQQVETVCLMSRKEK